MRTIFKTGWTPSRIKEFREANFLSQEQLAALLPAAQQRVSEWEKGLHEMKRPYSTLFDQVAEKFARLRALSSGSATKFKTLVQKEFGIELKSSKCK